MFGSNEVQVAPGLWAGLGVTSFLAFGPEVELHSTSSYITGSSLSSNASEVVSIHYFFPEAEMVADKDVVETVEHQRDEIRDAYSNGVGALPTQFFVRDQATVTAFRNDASSNSRARPQIMAFVGHSTLNEAYDTCRTSATCQATGLRFYGKSLVKEGYCSDGDTDILTHACKPQPWSFTETVPEGTTVPVRARVLIVSACAIGDLFFSMWAVDETPGQALVVPVAANKVSYSHLAAHAVIELSDQLRKHRTVQQAVDYVNNHYLGNVKNLLQFRVVGDQNVQFK